jgi:hypothetical protein
MPAFPRPNGHDQDWTVQERADVELRSEGGLGVSGASTDPHFVEMEPQVGRFV